MNDLYPSLAGAIQTIAVYALPLLFGITLHVSAQCFLAHRMGDRTAQMQGRLSLNPAKHIDLVGTIILPILCYIVMRVTGAGMIFGYAKPLPVNFGNLPNPKRGMLWISLTGIGANFAMAVAWLLLQLAFRLSHFDEDFFLQMASAGVKANLVLIGFYMIPLPPFDGGRILFSLLPDKQAYEYAKIEPYAFMIVFLLFVSGILTKFWIAPWFAVGADLLDLIFSPLNYLFT
jgi:Zn-dependent protease